MGQSLKDVIIHRVRQPLHDYNQSFANLQETGRDIEKTLESDTNLLAAIRKKFDELAKAVESEHQGTSFFNQEIKRTKEHIEKSIKKVSASLAISDQISEGLYRLAQSFDRIHTDGVQLAATVKNINIVADSIEVASRNAGITAFHAGRQGRGFEVIAREMTTLVRSAQEPITAIPEIAQHITQGTEQLGGGLSTINNLVDDLKNMNSRFSEISSSLLTLIPNVEIGIRAIGESVESQRKQHRLLLEENARTSHWLDDLLDMARTTAILEISLETLYRHVNNLRGNLLAVADDGNFMCIYGALRIALQAAGKRFEKIDRELKGKEVMSMDVESSEQWILQLGSSSNQLFQIVKKISDEIKTWLETNRLASQVLGEGVSFYESIAGHLSSLNKQLVHLKGTVENIEEPLYDLKKITDRSKVLGLYAGIESARGGDYALSLTVVTREIKDLSDETTTFVEKLNELRTDMSDCVTHLSGHLVKSMSDVEQGLSYLQSAIAILDENKSILDKLNRYAQNMIDSTETMTGHCNELTEHFQQLNKDHQRIAQNFNRYAQTVSQSAHTAEEILDVMNHYVKDVAILEKKSSTIVFRQALEPIVLDPANKTDAWSHEVIEQIFTGLVTFDSSNHLVPGLAEFFSVSKDGRTWDFMIKKNARFHNGDEITAYDVAATIARVKSSTNVNFIDYVDDAIVLDERRVRFTLKFAFLPFLANLACGVCDITSKDFSPEHPIGAGPYRLVQWDKNSEIILEAFDEFCDGRPPIDRVIFKIIENNKEAVARFKNGEITLMRLTPDTVKYIEPDQLVTGPGLKTQYLGIQVTHDTPFRDKRVRQAMNYAIDKVDYVQVVMEGQAVPGYGILPPGMEAYNESLVSYHHNLDRARTLMTEAGYPHGLEGTFPLDVSDSEVSITRAEYIKKSLEKIGITIELNPMPWKDFLEKGYRGESLLAMRGWVSDNGDPDNFLYPLFHSTSSGRPGNTSFYRSDEADRLIELARAERNSAKRNSIYQRVEELIVEDAPWIFLCHGVDSYAVAKNVHGFQIDPFGLVRFRYLWST